MVVELPKILLSLLVWPALFALPIYLTHNDKYKTVFPSEWYDTAPQTFWGTDRWPSPVGLSLGLLAVVVGQAGVVLYFLLFRSGYLAVQHPVQKVGAPVYELIDGVKAHFASPDGFAMLGGYLIITWMTGFMPASYYSFTGGINWKHVFLQLLIQDFVQFIMHKLEHDVSPKFYQISHKPHHRFTNPKLWDAFNGSLYDTFFMILVPLMITARCVDANVWSYMAFGSSYAGWLTLIHSEYVHAWDDVFRLIGFGTAADHHVHHKLFKYNFGHLFMYWDILTNQYRDPRDVSVFNKNVV